MPDDALNRSVGVADRTRFPVDLVRFQEAISRGAFVSRRRRNRRRIEKKGERDDDQKFGKDAKAHHVVEGPSFTVLNILLSMKEI